MKIKSGYMLNKLGNQFVVVAIGDRSKEFQGMIKLNESASFLWKRLEEEMKQDQLVAALQAEYELSEEVARRDVEAFLAILSQQGILAE
ncbi:PqqD family protein [Streptococcus suis]|uniref:PqqD family protein n=1 Tax=Streptococcus suis TaxID=1307 RepID=UPI001ABE6500|nr:PqqD family protein [Streptococcus suis]MBO4125953.1 PqqD family protein [Streptococcus suis]WFA75216.1 PqqD family protein [Streptococcus suis]